MMTAGSPIAKSALRLHDFRPYSQLVVRQTEVQRPRFSVVDGHNHLGGPFGGGWDKRPFAELLELLDEASVDVYIDLDGGWGEKILDSHLRLFKEKAPERFVIFGGVDWRAWPEKGDSFGEWAAKRLRAQAQRGAEGVKIWKTLGLSVRDHKGELVGVDDERLDVIWATAAELQLPVLAHVADPVAFFTPLNERNERWEELHAHPDWQFPSPPYPSFMTIMEQFEKLVARHPQTTFIGAHVGCYAENLGWVGMMLDSYTNFHVDISARISELGRQPYTARRFFLKHADRILFGTDAGPSLDAYRTYFRFLETDDEYFDYGSGDLPGQGRWRIYGLYLPDDVLDKVYRLNAQRLLNLKSN